MAESKRAATRKQTFLEGSEQKNSSELKTVAKRGIWRGGRGERERERERII